MNLHSLISKKKSIIFLLTVVLLITPFSQVLAVSQDVLTGNVWKSVNGNVLMLNKDGTGSAIYSAGTISITYTMTGDEIVYSYPISLGSFTINMDQKLVYCEEGGISCLCDPDKGVSVRSGVWFPESQIQSLIDQYNTGYESYEVKLGEEIDLGFLTMTVDQAQSLLEIKSEKGGISPVLQAGNRFLTLKGRIRNTGKSAMNLENLSGMLLLNGQKTEYRVYAFAELAEGMLQEIPVNAEGTLFIYAEVPEKEATSFTEAEFLITINDGLGTVSTFLNTADFLFSYRITDVTAEAARQLPQKEIKYFEESPSLIRPESLVDVTQTNWSTSKSNGKYKKIQYKFAPVGSGNANALMQEYGEKMKEAGYTVSTKKNQLQVSFKKKELVTVTVESGKLVFNVKPGNEKFNQHP